MSLIPIHILIQSKILISKQVFFSWFHSNLSTQFLFFLPLHRNHIHRSPPFHHFIQQFNHFLSFLQFIWQLATILMLSTDSQFFHELFQTNPLMQIPFQHHFCEEWCTWSISKRFMCQCIFLKHIQKHIAFYGNLRRIPNQCLRTTGAEK